jgi:AAA+ superfamily predicted ATPase
MSESNPTSIPALRQSLPPWAVELQTLFRAGVASQFIIHGNVTDVVAARQPDGSVNFLSLKKFLDAVMLDSYDAILHYNRGQGIRVSKGDKEWSAWVTTYLAKNPAEIAALSMREPIKALELIDHYMLRTLNLEAIKQQGNRERRLKLAVVIDYAEFILPKGDALAVSGDIASHIVKILGWANDPVVLNSNIVTFLITEKLNDLNSLVAENPHAAKIEIKLPDERETLEYLTWLQASQFPGLTANSDLSIGVLAKRFAALNRISARNLVASALNNGQRITETLLSKLKKDAIERECQDLLEFSELPYTLDYVAGLDAAKTWLREDAQLIRAGKSHALPMGYLICGRIGTGKTFLVQCWAGELGIPCVVFKNFRDKWVGSTESKLEKIFQILRALGQVIVFVDEADQMTGRRDSGSSDSGLSGRIYAMLAKEMSDTRQRGKIIWVFATSRPDLVEVDLKRQGRLDIHIPLFPPQSQEEYRVLLLNVAKKLKFPLKPEEIPVVPEGSEFGGHEIEGMLVRSLRRFELESPPRPLAEIFQRVAQEVKPSAAVKKLEYMDLVAIRECTDAGFLPAKYAQLSPEDVERRIDELRRFF